MSWVFWFGRKKLPQDTCFIFWNVFSQETLSPLPYPWSNYTRYCHCRFQIFWLLRPTKLDSAFLGFRHFYYVQFGGFQQNINGQSSGVLDKKNGGQKIRIEWRMPCCVLLKCVWMLQQNFQDDTLLYSVTREIVQVDLMFSSRARAGLEDPFEQRLCLMLLGYLGFSGLAHPVKAEQYTIDQKWQIDFSLHANSNQWAVAMWGIEKDSGTALGFNRRGLCFFPPSVFPQVRGGRRERAQTSSPSCCL